MGMKKKPILIGFAAQLSGKQCELGVQERNGVLLAVEQINASGGIAGRNIELIIRDDRGISAEAVSIDQELVKAGVLAIIGHSKSQQTLAGLQVTNPARVVMISPTASTPDLSGLNDYFFRVHSSTKESAQAFAQYIYQRSGLKKIAIIYDEDNAAYSRAYSKILSDKFLSLGGEIACEVGFSSVLEPNFSDLLYKLRESKPDGMLIVASDIDTALIAQSARIIGWNIPLFTSPWAGTKTLINNGGHAVEGMIFEQSYASPDTTQTFRDFQTYYEARFGNSPSYSAALSYDAAMVLAAALKKTGGKAEGLRQELLEIGEFPGIHSSFCFNSFGDVERPSYIGIIRQGKFVFFEQLILNKYGGL